MVLEKPMAILTRRPARGTPRYMAPEQAAGRADAAVDRYAVGHLAFTLLVVR